MSPVAEVLLAVLAATLATGVIGLFAARLSRWRAVNEMRRSGVVLDLTDEQARLVVALSPVESRSAADLAASVHTGLSDVLESARRLQDGGWVRIGETGRDVPVIRLTSAGAEFARRAAPSTGQVGSELASAATPPVPLTPASEEDLDEAIDSAVAHLQHP